MLTIEKLNQILLDCGIEATEDQLGDLFYTLNQMFKNNKKDDFVNANAFDAACNEVDVEYTGESTQENVIEFIKNSNLATITFSQGRYINKIKKLAEKNPDDVDIVCENTDGSIVAHIPTRYIHINNIRREMTEEQRIAAAERLKNWKANNAQEK